jgi:transcriptional regulator with PAS, ATPase and Fis domain
MENINRYGALNRLIFELQFAKEMKLSDILFLTQGWQKEKKLMLSNAKAKVKAIIPIFRKGVGLLIGNSSAINSVKDLVKKYAPLKAPILVTGETGTGKELVSRAIHDEGAYSQEPFLAINCGALTESLLQSELFGYVAGAFTGAQKERLGIFEAAGKGTVFLDEFGDISPLLQVSLLRVLEANEIRMIGGTVTRKIECRIVIATNVDLQIAVKEKKFREDLYYRLKRFEIKIPALRERAEDISFIIDHFLNFENEPLTTPKKISPELLMALTTYGWPGNIRELKNEIERLKILLKEKEIINLEDFDFQRLQGYSSKIIDATLKPLATNVEKDFQSLPKNNFEKSVTSECIANIIHRGSKADRRIAYIKELFLQYRTLKRNQIVEITKVNPTTATNDLQKLCDEGFIVRHTPTSSPSSFYFEIVDKK